MDPLVSICCETFNQEAFLKDALEGFVMQKTDFPFEVLIHDDASTDRTPEIVRDYVRRYPGLFKPIYQTENQWSRHVNIWTRIQFPRAKGKYIALCEGDDYWTDPLKLQKQVDFLEAHPDFVLCCSAFTQTMDGNEGVRSEVRFDVDEVRLDDILKGFWIGTLTTVIRKKAILDYQPPFPGLPMSDLPLWGYLATQGRIKYLQDITANYRSLSSSACHFPDDKKQFSFQLEAMRVREYYALAAGRAEVAAPAFSKNAHYYLDQCYQHGWLDFPQEKVWHFLKEYGDPSGYDKLKHWGLKSRSNYFLSRKVLSILKKHQK